jgi:hypothetical protein
MDFSRGVTCPGPPMVRLGPCPTRVSASFLVLWKILDLAAFLRCLYTFSAFLP